MSDVSQEQPVRRIEGPGATNASNGQVPIDIDTLTEAQLLDLNRRIVARMRFIQQMRAHKQMLDFSVGQRVRFRTDMRIITGVLTQYNRKSVTVMTDDGRKWRVSPVLLEAAG